jgi:hypothetical protein
MTHKPNLWSRRAFLKLGAAGAVALPFWRTLLGGPAAAMNGRARRLIIFYFPDGCAGMSQDGQPSQWHAQGSELGFSLPNQLQPLERLRQHCVFLNGLSMGGTDSGSHPGGAKKLLTGVDGGGGQSIDQYLSNTVGANSYWRHLYLGVMANQNGASGDKHIVYPSAGQTLAPQDNPLVAFERLFGQGVPMGGGNNGGGGSQPDPEAVRRRRLQESVIDGALGDLDDLRARLGGVERAKLNQHLEALREVERRVQSQPDPETPDEQPEAPATCDQPGLDTQGFDSNQQRAYDPSQFPSLMRLQIDLMVQAMACDLTRVGTIQASHHTSDLIMSRFPASEMYDPGFDMRSHQASHYGSRHDDARREFHDYVLQRRWFVTQFAYLLDQLRARPEGDGTMLDHSLVWMCTEVSDGNTHLHDNMPFVLGGGGGGAIRTGRLLQFGYERHSNLLVALARAMGQDLNNFGQESRGPLPGLLA